MIGYLEQLERDLVVAIDRREATGAVQRHRPRLRTVAIVVAALLAGVAIGIAIHSARDQTREIPAKPPRPTAVPTPPPNTGAVGTPKRFALRGDFVRYPNGSWRGVAAGTGIRAATFTLTGTVEFRNLAQHRLRWEWVTPRGRISGCVNNTMYRRPRGRWVWDGGGRVMTANGRMRRWRGVPIGFGGLTYTDDVNHAHLALDDISSDTAQQKGRGSNAFVC